MLSHLMGALARFKNCSGVIEECPPKKALLTVEQEAFVFLRMSFSFRQNWTGRFIAVFEHGDSDMTFEKTFEVVEVGEPAGAGDAINRQTGRDEPAFDFFEAKTRDRFEDGFAL